MKITLSLLTLATLVASARAELKLPAIIGDNMVLQQKQANPIWGWDVPGTAVTVSFAGQTKNAKAGPDGKWMVKIDAVPANEKPQSIKIKGTNERELKNILVGEVWLCSGQSNMQFAVGGNWDSDLEIATANGVCGAQFAGALFDCDPMYTPDPVGWDIVRYASAAVLESVLRCSDVDKNFAELQTRYPEVGEYQEAL